MSCVRLIIFYIGCSVALSISVTGVVTFNTASVLVAVTGEVCKVWTGRGQSWMGDRKANKKKFKY